MSRVRANTVTNFAGTGTPSLPYGIQVGTGATVSGGTNTISASTNGSERLRITSAGNVAIGTITASIGNLTVYGDGTTDNKPATIYQNVLSGGGGSTNGFYVGINHNETVGYVWNYETQPLVFGTNNLERLRIDSSGLISNGGLVPSDYGSPNLLISGTDSTFTLMGNGSTNNSSFTGIKFRVAGASAGDYTKAGIFAQRQGGYNDLALIFALDTVADSSSVSIADEKMRIDSAGRILKGWNGTAFDGPSNGTDIAVAGTSSNNGIQVGRYSTNYGAYALTIFRSRGTSVGTNLPTVSNDEVGHITWWGDDGSNWRDIAEISGVCDGNTDSGSSPGKIIFKTTKSSATDSTQAMTIKADHNIEVHDGNIVFETAGNGIDFSATTDTAGMTSELFNDYEVGTWTPTLGGSMTLNSGTWVATGYYTKIGNIVNIEMKQTSGNVSWGAGGLIIGGVPFTPAGSGGGIGGASGSMTNTSPNISMSVLQWSSGYIYAPEAGANQTTMRITITFRVS